MKKAAIMLYPLFSMQEISCTTELFKFYGKEIVSFAAGGEAVKSEDGFTVLPDRGFEEFRREDFDCLILPGIWEPLPVLLDDTFAYYDDTRLKNTLSWLAVNKSQVILFTCQNREEEALKQLGIRYRKIKI